MAVTAPEPQVFTGICNLCDWSERWSNRDAAGSAATWHVFDKHPEAWFEHLSARRWHDKEIERMGIYRADRVDDDRPRDPRPELIGTRL